MTRAPYFIRALLDVHTLPNPELSEMTTKELQGLGLIEQGFRDLWTTTARGRAYVELLCNVPLPEQKWIDQREKP